MRIELVGGRYDGTSIDWPDLPQRFYMPLPMPVKAIAGQYTTHPDECFYDTYELASDGRYRIVPCRHATKT